MKANGFIWVTAGLLFFLYSAIVPASAGGTVIEQGATVFIGEQGLNVTHALNAAQGSPLNGVPPLQSIGFWAPGGDPYTMAPTTSRNLTGRYTNFLAAPADFLGYTGNWYVMNGAGHAVGLAFIVADPSLSMVIWDLKNAGDVSGKSVAQGTRLTFRINTNMYPAVNATYRSPLNPDTDGYVTIKLRDESAVSYTSLWNNNIGIPHAGPNTLSANYVDTGSWYWGADGPFSWETGALGGAPVQPIYPMGTYMAWAESTLHSMKDNYKNSGADYTGKTVSPSYTITIVATGVTPLADFTANTRSGLTPLPVQFIDTSFGSPTSWSWTFGDGKVSSEQNPVHLYDEAGIYTVSLTVSNSNGSDSVTKTNYILVTEPPFLSATANRSIGPKGTVFHFSGQNTYGDSPGYYTNIFVVNNTPPVQSGSLPNDGVKPDNFSLKTITGNNATFIQAPVAGGSWHYDWNTSGIAGGSILPGTLYTFYFINETLNRSALKYQSYTRVQVGIEGPVHADYRVNTSFGTTPLTVEFTDISTGIPATVDMSFGDGTWTNSTGSWVHTYTREGTFFPVIYASNSISSNSSTNATISVNVTPGLDAGLAKAYNAVLNNASLLNHTSAGKSVYASRVLLTAGSPVQRWGGKPAILAPQTQGWTGWMIFIDEQPHANWEHPCRFVFVDNAGKTTAVRAFSPPTNINLRQISGETPNPGGDANSVNSVSQNPGGGLGTLNLNAACTGPDCSHNYALLISGGFNSTQNHVRYWNDISFMYQTLNQTYGYPTDHITVLMSDGTSPAPDRHNATAANYDILTDNSPVDLDCKYGFTDVSGDARKLTLTTTLASLNSRLTSADNLFIFTTSHGGWDDIANSNKSTLYLWNEEYITDTEFVAALPSAPRNITLVMEQCYSGGFIDNFIDLYTGPQRRVITTAANGSEPSWGNGFSNAWTSGVARIDEERLPNFRADVNQDNQISMWEAYNYSLSYDPSASPLLPVHEHPQYSAKNPATAGTSQYLSTCPPLPTLSLTAPSVVETWYTGYSRNITWTQTGLDATTVTISLWNRTPAVKLHDIATNVPASLKTYQWNIPADLAPGNDYRVNISSVSPPAPVVYDQSDSPFILAKYAVPGFINVNTMPPGAGVYLDGYNQSRKTNVTLTGIPPGSHNISVKLAGYYEQESGIIVSPGKTSTLTFRMESTGTNEPPYGTMVITSTPPAAEIVIDGTATGLMTPFKKEVDPKTYAITVKAYGYTTPANQSITVVKGKQVSADFPLILTPVLPLPGYANFPTDPDHDGIYEDLNGNNRLDFADIVLYFNQMEWIAAHEPISAFDLNANSRIDFADIVKLFGEI